MTDNGSPTHIDVLLEAYKTRVQLLITQGNRLWTRFNYFLAINLGLSALYFVYDKSIALIIGIMFSGLWYWIAANDHYHLRLERRRVSFFEEKHFVHLFRKTQLKPLYTEKIRIKQSWICFNVKPLRVTGFSVYFPVIFTVFWVVLLIKKGS